MCSIHVLKIPYLDSTNPIEFFCSTALTRTGWVCTVHFCSKPCAVNKLRNIGKNSLGKNIQFEDSNLGQLGVERKCFHCAMPTPLPLQTQQS